MSDPSAENVKRSVSQINAASKTLSEIVPPRKKFSKQIEDEYYDNIATATVVDEEATAIVPRKRTPRAFKDAPDVSLHPSYANFKLPYEVVCRQRYRQTYRNFDKQFKSELKKLETYQPSAYEALRFNRIFAITTLWPPLHTKKEIDYVLQNFYKIPAKQQERLNTLLNYEQD